ncbi:hypothetical protein [Micromonospora sp. WMMD812]|uniref:hypothetical protein n=1 Tax=Micromonospora sp. WMMD812 TaxID=3015152 RepID=UPI00248B3EA9|nr:hypothetical protein [Micromonospora sp. WMMD812]WBB67868.1 hypothetical protein O7603_00365 [Micromonospora sp. WMMD812]
MGSSDARDSRPKPAYGRDEISDAWMLAVADTATARLRERLHVWLDSGETLLGRSSADREQAAEPSPDGSPTVVAVAWFEPVAGEMVQTLAGMQCEAQVESAVLMGLPRWLAATALPESARWVVRVHPMGLALHDPTGQTFARGVAEIPPEWTTAAIAHDKVLAVYGVGDERQEPPPPSRRLRRARDRGAVAAAWVPLQI